MPITLRFKLYGRCAEAMALYEQAFGAKTEYVEYYSDGKPEKRVRRARLDILGMRAEFLDEADELNRPRATPVLSLSARLNDAESVRRAYALLKAGGSVTRAMRVAKAHACAAELTDAFGISWDLLTDAPPPYVVKETQAADIDMALNVIAQSLDDMLADRESPAAFRAWANKLLIDLRKGLESGRLMAYMMFEGADAVGAAVICARAEEASIDAFYTLERARGVGAGRFFMDRLIEALADRGITRAVLWTAEDDMRARFFFDDCSFSLTGETRDAGAQGAVYPQVKYELITREYEQ